jgi:hypothetical protein
MSLRTLRVSFVTRLRWFLRAVEAEDESMVEEVLRLSRRRRLFAPLAYTVGAFAMLIQGLRRLLANWWLIPVEILPAIWLWFAMFDLRQHVLRGESFFTAHEEALIPIALLIVVITIVALFLNVVFAFAVAQHGKPSIRPAFAEARARSVTILATGAIVGTLLAVSATVGARWQAPWFTLALGASVGLMMVVYLSLPGRLLRLKRISSRRDRLTASALGGLLATVVSTPSYLISRLGILMLGSSILVIPGYLVLTLGVVLQAGGTGAVRAIRMSGALVHSKSTAVTGKPAERDPSAPGASGQPG